MHVFQKCITNANANKQIMKMSKKGKSWRIRDIVSLIHYFPLAEVFPTNIKWIHLNILSALQTAHCVTENQHLIHGHLFA